MFRRRGVGRRGPGLVGTVARTAAVAGTATVTAKAVGGAMDSHAQAKQQAQADQAAATQQQAQPAQDNGAPAQTAPAAAAPAAAAGAEAAAPTALVDQLQQLAQMKQSGMLTDEEFQAAKAKLLGS